MTVSACATESWDRCSSRSFQCSSAPPFFPSSYTSSVPCCCVMLSEESHRRTTPTRKTGQFKQLVWTGPDIERILNLRSQRSLLQDYRNCLSKPIARVKSRWYRNPQIEVASCPLSLVFSVAGKDTAPAKVALRAMSGQSGGGDGYRQNAPRPASRSGRLPQLQTSADDMSLSGLSSASRTNPFARSGTFASPLGHLNPYPSAFPTQAAQYASDLPPLPPLSASSLRHSRSAYPVAGQPFLGSSSVSGSGASNVFASAKFLTVSLDLQGVRLLPDGDQALTIRPFARSRAQSQAIHSAIRIRRRECVLILPRAAATIRWLRQPVDTGFQHCPHHVLALLFSHINNQQDPSCMKARRQARCGPREAQHSNGVLHTQARLCDEHLPSVI